MSPYEVWLSPDAERAFGKLNKEARNRIRKALLTLASDVASGMRIEGKKVKTIKGTADTFHRLRVGDHRVMYDVIPGSRTILVLGIVSRGELESWLRRR